MSARKKILFVCTGNTCRSPMAKIVMEQFLEEKGFSGRFDVDSAGTDGGIIGGATDQAKAAVRRRFGGDLLADHRSKSIKDLNLDEYDLILTMSSGHKKKISHRNVHTLKEYAGLSGDISDPIGRPDKVYEHTLKEIEDAICRILPRLTATPETA